MSAAGLLPAAVAGTGRPPLPGLEDYSAGDSFQGQATNCCRSAPLAILQSAIRRPSTCSGVFGPQLRPSLLSLTQ